MGIILIIFCFCYAGFLKSKSLQNRSKKLSAFYDGLSTLCEYIEQGGLALDEVIKNSFVKCKFLKFENGRYCCCDTDLKKEEKNEIDAFFKELGSSTKKIECDRVTNFAIKLKKNLSEAQQDALTNGRVYQTFGICIGIGIGILLI